MENTKLQYVEMASMGVIIIFIIFLAFEAEFRMIASRSKEPPPQWIIFGNVVFAVAFGIEVAIKLALMGKGFFKKKSGRVQGWNMFDVFLIFVSVLDIMVEFLNLSSIRFMRFFRVLRFARIFRTIRHFTHLRYFVASIVSSLPMLFWALLMISLLLYFCSLIVMQGVEDYISAEGLDPDLLKYFGSLGNTLVSLFMSLSGGIDWGDVMNTLVKVSPAFLPFFVVFVGFMSFAVVGVLTAVIIEASSGILSYDKDLAIQQRIEANNQKRRHLRSLFEEVDRDNSGVITYLQLKQTLEKIKVQAFLESIHLGIHHTENLFSLLDKDSSGKVDMDEFVDGLMKNSGVVAVIADGNYRINQQLAVLMKLCGGSEGEAIPCACGNAMMPDALFCRRCGKQRPA